MGFRIGRGGKGFLKVFENVDQESENRIFDSKFSKIEKKFCRLCQNVQILISEFAQNAIPKCRFLPTLRKCQNARKSGSGSPKCQKVTKTRFFDKKTTKKQA